jgi:hypothetical protein
MKWLSGFVFASLVGVGSPAFSQVVMDSDDNVATLAGTWTQASAPAGFYGSDYASAQGGGGSDTARFFSPKPIGATGNWCVEARWTAGANRATNAHYRVFDGSALRNTFVADQTQNGGAWRILGCVLLTAGQTSEVRLSDASVSAARVVVADGVRWVWDEGAAGAGDFCIAVNGGFGGDGGTTFIGKGFATPPNGACRPWSGIVRTATTVVGTTSGSACLSDDGKLFTASLHSTAPEYLGPGNVAVDHIELCPLGTTAALCPAHSGQSDRGYFAFGPSAPAAGIACTPALVSIPSDHD